jgi:hypothetical protein
VSHTMPPPHPTFGGNQDEQWTTDLSAKVNGCQGE